MLCYFCGKQNDNNVSACLHCGEPLQVDALHEAKESSDPEVGFSRPDSEYIRPEVMLMDIALEKHIESEEHIEPEVSPQQKLVRMKIPYTKVFLGLSSAFAIILLLLIFVRRSENDTIYTFVSKDALEVYKDDDKNETYIFNTNGDQLFTIQSSLYPIYNPDRTAAVLVGDDEFSGNSIYFVNENELIELKNGINTFAMSDNGKYILYSAYNGMNGYYLYLYDVDNKKEEFIDKVNSERTIVLPNISADGKTITYVTFRFPTNEIENLESYLIRNGGKPVNVGKDIFIFAISDDGKYMYYCDYIDNSFKSLYVKKDGKSIKLGDNFMESSFSFNNDYSEIMFSSNGNTYISIDGNERQFVANSPLVRVITPPKCISHNKVNVSMVLYGVESFRNSVILCNDNSLRLIGDQNDSEKIGSVSIERIAQISQDGNELIYVAPNKNVIKVSGLKGKYSEETYIEQMDDFVASVDLSEAYYRKGNQLYYRNKNGETVFIAEDMRDLQMNSEGTAAFFRTRLADEGQLYYSTKGEAAKPVRGISKISEINDWNYGIAFRAESVDGYQLYYNTSGVEVKLIMNQPWE